MTQQDKERIEREAIEYSSTNIIRNPQPYDPDFSLNELYTEVYKAGATAEHERAQKEIAEKDKRIEELEKAIKTVIAYGYESDILQQALKPKQ